MHRGLWRLTTLAACLGLAGAVVITQSWRALEPLDATGRITYFVSEGRPGSRYQPSDRDLATWALQAWERELDGVVRFEAAPEKDALVSVHWVPAEGGLYGEMQPLIINGRRGAAVYIRPDIRGLGPELSERADRDPLFRDTIVYLTCVHELGHALGLEHTDDFRDIMFFFGYGGDIPRFFGRYRDQVATRSDIARTSGLSPADIARVRALYPRR